MGPLDALRRTEQQIQEAARHGAEVAKTTLHSVETQVRRMHLNFGRSQRDADAERASSPRPKVRTGIVSVNGHDVEKMRCTGGRKTA
jgi:hypothetical protein